MAHKINERHNAAINVKTMIERANIYDLDDRLNCTLSTALINKNFSAANVIVSQYEHDLALVDKTYKGLTFLAIRDEDVKTVGSLLTWPSESLTPKQGTLIKVLSKNPALSLNQVTEIYITSREQLKLLNILNRNGLIDVNVRNYEGKSLLDIAVENNSFDIVKRLLKLGAVLNVRCYDAIDGYGLYDLNAFQYAVAKGYAETVEELLKNINLKKLHPESNETLLHYAALSGNKKVFRIIFKAITNMVFSTTITKTEAEIDEINKLLEHKIFKYDNESILHRLIQSGCIDLFTESLIYKPNIKISTKLQFDQNTLLDFAVLSNNLPLVKLLIRKGLEPHTFYGSEINSLIIASRKTVNFDIFQELVKNSPVEIFQNRTNGCKQMLFNCIRSNSSEKVRHLIDVGLNINYTHQNSNCLLESIWSDNIEMVKFIVDHLEIDGKTNKKKYLNTPDYNKNHPIDLCVRLTMCVDILKYLLELGAELNVANRQGYSPLHFACLFGHHEAVKIMLENGADVNAVNDRGDMPIQSAAKSGCYETFKLLLKKEVDINLRNKKGQTFLICAARSGGVRLCEELIKAGADVNAANHDNNTALHYAEDKDIISLLVKNGANLMALNKYNCTPYLEHACRWEWREEFFKNHLKFDIDYSVVNNAKENLLHIIFRENRHKKPILLKLPEIFRERKFEPLFKYTDTNIYGETLLLLACSNKNNPLEILKKIFLFSEPDLNIKPKIGEGAIYKLIENNHVRALWLILDRGANVELAGTRGQTPLITAASKTVEIVDLLLKYGAKINAQDELGDTALHKAVRDNKFHIARVLVAAGADLKIANNEQKFALDYDIDSVMSTFFNNIV